LTIKRVTNDVDGLEFNTAIAACMELVNDLYKIDEDAKLKIDLFYFALRQLILIMAPLAPHLCEELWHMIGDSGSVFAQPWPGFDPQALELRTITMAIQINGKLRGSFDVSADITEDQLFAIASKDDRVSKYLDGMQVVKRIFVPGKLLNMVVKGRGN
jgi:leucyl-tRNA synthetase